MKSLKFASVFILSLLVFTMTSCDDEPLEGQFDTGGGGGGGDMSCAEATDNVATATTAFFDVTPADPNYTMVCNNYMTALQNFITACGDSSGGAQAIIDSLDCSVDVPDECPSAQAATDAAETAYNSDTTNTTLCNAYLSALENEITVCGDATGALQDIIDGLSCL